MPNATPCDLLPGQLFLLCCRPGKDRLPNRQRVAQVIRAAALGQLLLDGHLVDMDGIPERAVLSRLTDPVLEQVATEISGARSRSWRAWLRRNTRPTLQAVQDQLAAEGIIRTEPKRFLGIVPRTAVTVADQALQERLRARIDSALDTSVEVSAQDAMLVALTAAGDLRWVIPRAQRRTHRKHIAELTERSAPVAPLLGKMIRSMQSAGAVAATSGGS